MREIKFRAWNGRRMIYEGDKELDHIALTFDGRLVTAADTDLVIVDNNSDSFKLMQFTGLHDKNGKEIYERDIVKGREGTTKGVVEFGAYTKWRYTKHDSETQHVGWYVQTKEGKVSLEDLEWYIKPTNYAPFRGSYLEVIGNIYESPELLENK